MISVSQRELTKALGDVGLVVPSRSPVDSARSVIIYDEADGIVIEGYNSELFLRKKIVGSGLLGGTCVVQHSVVYNTIRCCRSEVIELSIESGKLLVSDGENRFTFETFTPESKPKFSVQLEKWGVCESSRIGVALGTISHCLTKVEHSQIRPDCIYWKLGGSSSVLAVDGRRMFMMPIHFEGLRQDDEYKFLLHQNYINALTPLLGSGAIEVFGSSSMVGFSGRDWQIAGSLMDGKSLDAARMFQDQEYSITVTPQDLKAAARAIEPFAEPDCKEDRPAIRVEAGNGKVVLSCRARNLGSGEVSIPAKTNNTCSGYFQFRYIKELAVNTDGILHFGITPKAMHVRSDLGLLGKIAGVVEEIARENGR
jgi:DNA polymerase III sliding clamp (beta) subunit (PCNA family)